MKEQPYSKQFKTLLDYIIQHRISMVEGGRSRRPESYMRRQLQKLSVNVNRNWTDIGAAMFIQAHYSEIRELISSKEINVKTQLDNMYSLSFFFVMPNDDKDIIKAYNGKQWELPL